MAKWLLAVSLPVVFYVEDISVGVGVTETSQYAFKVQGLSIIYFMLGNHDCLQTNMAHWGHITTLAVNKVWPKVAN